MSPSAQPEAKCKPSCTYRYGGAFVCLLGAVAFMFAGRQ
jgi:hypothetical protein